MAGTHTPSTYRKKAIPNAVRREVATRYGCPPGGELEVPCHYCGSVNTIHWWRQLNGKPAYWVSFGHELHHLVPEVLGGSTTADNLVLACRPCNRRKGAKA